MKKVLGLFCFLSLNMIQVYCQCPIVESGPDQILCEIPGIFVLDGSINGTTIFNQWTPSSGLSDPNSLTPIATVSSPTTYYLCAKSIDYTTNLITNGDFESGNTSFTTDYTYNANPTIPSNQLIEGQYTVGSNPAPMHINWQACGDHTTGSGNMMLINGHQTANQNAWCQSIPITPNTEYAFSVWVASVDPNGPSEIQFRINGSPVGASSVALNTPCIWTNFFVLWNSGANTTADICIRDLNTIEMGNDFAIDDVVFSPVCTEKDSVLLSPFEVNGTIYNNGPICEGDDLELEADGGTTYSWNGPIGFNSTSDINTLQNTTVDMTGNYSVIITGEGDCTDILSTYVEIFAAQVVFDTIPTCNPNGETSNTNYLTNQYGCDSTVHTHVMYRPSDNTILESTICDPSSVGDFVTTLQNKYGCDSIVTNKISLAPTDTVLLQFYTCDSTKVAIDTTVLTNQFGCDSSVISQTVYIDKYEIALDSFTCDSTQSGVFVDSLISQTSCDSTVTRSIKYIKPDTTYLKNGSCDSTLIGSFTQDLNNQFGCDSTVISTISLYPSYNYSIESFTCIDTLVGQNVQKLTTTFSCDSVVTTDIKPLQKDTTIVLTSSCDSTAIGAFIDKYTNLNGCDSVVYTNVILDPSNTVYLSETTCDPSKAGSFIKKLSNQYGCDSIVYTEIALLQSDTLSIYNSTCSLSEAGVFTQNLKNEFGCDSIVTTHVVLSTIDTIYIMNTTCESMDSGQTITYLTNQFGCDSLVITRTTLNPSSEQTINLITCDSFEVGITNQILLNQYGCDSTIITNTILAPKMYIVLFISQLDCFTDNTGEIKMNAVGGLPPYQYSLNNSSFQSEGLFDQLTNGFYKLNVMDNLGCVKSEIIILNSIMPVTVDLGKDQSISLGDSAIIQSKINVPYDSLILLEWTEIDNSDCPQCPNQVVYPIVTTTYSIKVVNTDGCSAEDQLTIYVDNTKHINIPNVFSPNGDGTNDIFMIYGRESEVNKVISFIGFDRWGNKMWSNYDFPINIETYGWNGLFNNQPVNPGVYIWVAQIEFVDGEILNLSGDVTLLR